MRKPAEAASATSGKACARSGRCTSTGVRPRTRPPAVTAIATTRSSWPSAQPSRVNLCASNVLSWFRGVDVPPNRSSPERGLAGPPRGSRSATSVGTGDSAQVPPARARRATVSYTYRRATAAREYARHLGCPVAPALHRSPRARRWFSFSLRGISHQRFNGWSQHVAPLPRYTSTKQRIVYRVHTASSPGCRRNDPIASVCSHENGRHCSCNSSLQ